MLKNCLKTVPILKHDKMIHVKQWKSNKLKSKNTMGMEYTTSIRYKEKLVQCDLKHERTKQQSLATKI